MARETTPEKSQGGFSAESLRSPLLAGGAVLLVLGLVSLLIFGDAPLPLPVGGNLPWTRILLAAGILLLGVYVALGPEDMMGRLTSRSALYGGNAVVLSVAALGILALLNVLGSRYQAKADLTQNKRFTLSEQSFRVAEGLPEPVKVTGFFQGSDSRQQDLLGVLNDYAARSNGKLTYAFVDPELELLQKAIAERLGFRLVDHRMELYGVALRRD